MKFSRCLTILPLIALISLTACRQRPAPDPSITAVRPGQRGSSVDWIDPEGIARAQSLGLDLRDPSMSGAEGDYIEGMFQPVYFDFDQSFVRPQDRTVLQEAADYLNQNSGARLLVEGHADWRGTTEYNMALGDRRAGSVKSYLSQLGISGDRIETVSKGDLEATTEGSESEMQEDRRADLLVVPGS